MRAVVGQTMLAVGAAILAGVVLGIVWRWAAPPIEVTVGAGISTEQANKVFGAEGVYAAIMVCAGAVSAIIARGWLRHAGPLAVLGVVVAGIIGSVVAWRVGVWAGPERITESDVFADGQVVLTPLGVHSHGLLLAWSITAVFTLLWIAALSPDPSVDRAQGDPQHVRSAEDHGATTGDGIGVGDPARVQAAGSGVGESSRQPGG